MPFFRRFRLAGAFAVGLLANPLPLPADVVVWDVSDQNLVTPPSVGDASNSGNTAVGVWFNLFNGEAYVVDDEAGVEGKTDVAEGRYQLRWNVYYRDNEEGGLPSTEVLIWGNFQTTRLLGTTVSQPNAGIGSPQRLDEGVEVPVGGAFSPAGFIEMAGAFGVWQERGRGFLALMVRHPSLPQFHYGYADVTILDDGRIRLNGFAYNDTPNTTLTTTYIGAPAPAAATGLSVTGTTATTVSLAWTDNSSTETGFKIQRQGPGESAFATVATTAPDATSYTDEGLAASTAYTYQVVATTGLDAAASNSVVGTTGAVSGPPTDPTDFAVTPLTSTSLELTWVDHAIDEVGYRIERASGSGFAPVTTTGPSATRYVDTGLLPGTSYTYRLTATNGLDSATLTSAPVRTFSVRESTGAEAAAASYPAVDGSGVVVGIWDFAPARSTHVEFAGPGGTRLTNLQGGEAGSDSLSNHTTHSAGLVAARGADPTAEGVAPGAEVDVYTVDSDLTEFLQVGMQWAGQPDRLQVANGSYGPIRGWNQLTLGAVKWTFNVPAVDGAPQPLDPNFGAYTDYAHDADDVLWQRPYLLMVRSAGNDRDDQPKTSDLVYLSSDDFTNLAASVYNPAVHPPRDGGNNGGYGIVSDAAAAKNTLTVGAIAGARRDGDGVLLFTNEENDFANWGPTKDGRIKPDLVAPAIDIRSAGYASDTAYSTLTGSSQAAPQVAGAAALLVDAWSQAGPQAALRASTLKALLVHTADDLGTPGPDAKTGWGLVNAKGALDVAMAHLTDPSAGRIVEGELAPGATTRTYSVSSDGSREVRVTLVWTDPAGTENSPTPLVHDLNLDVNSIDWATAFYPFVLAGDDPGAPVTTGINPVDTVEQVRISNYGGEFLIRVSLDGVFSTDSQPYSLVITGATAIQPLGPGPKPIRALVTTPGTLEVTGGDFALGTQVVLENGTGQTVPVSAVEVLGDRVRFAYDDGAVTDGAWYVVLTQPDGRSSRLRWPVGESTPRGYEDWLLAHFSAAELLDPAVTWFGVEGGATEVPLLAAYAFGANGPDVAEARLPDIATVENGGQHFLEATYTRRQNLDVALVVEVTEDPAGGTWTALSGAMEVEVTDLGDGSERVRVRDPYPLDGSDRHRFMRLRVDWD